MNDMTGVHLCKSCGSQRFKLKYRFKKRSIIQCLGCGLLMIDPIPTLAELKAVYDKDYFFNRRLLSPEAEGIFGYVDYLSERANKQRNYRSICRRIQRYVLYDRFRENARVLDYGCGLGFFLEMAAAYGFDVTGIEFNPFAIAYIRNQYPYSVLKPDDFASLKSCPHVITMFDVIEHLPDPFSFLPEVSRKLAENGLLVISTMDSNSFVSRLLGKRLEDFRRISEHIYFFSKKNLIRLLIKNGFEILEVKSIGHTFSLELFFSRLNNIVPILPHLFQFLMKVLPFLRKVNFYFNPRTKIIIYARKKAPSLEAADPGKMLSIVIPVYNEEQTIEKVIEKLQRLRIAVATEIIVVNDGSTDGTSGRLQRYCRDPGILIVEKATNEGKGAAVRDGIRHSRGEYVIIQDADLEYDPEDIPSLLQVAAATGACAVYGSRFYGRFRKTGYFFNTLANRGLTFFTNLITGLNLSDMESGYKLFSGDLIRSLELKSRSFEFEPEVTCKIARKKIPIYEAPISYNARSYFEGKKIRFRDGLKAIKTIIKYGVLKRK